MNTSIYLTLKYWKKHLKNALALLFSGTLTVTVITVFWLIKREDVNRDIQNRYYSHGRYQVIAGNSYDEFNEKLTEGRDDIQHGRFNVLGELGGSQKFAYGTIEDEYDLAYIPLESGRLPESGDELAADRGALDRLFWVGKCGDTVTFDGNTYTVVGIIDERYGKFRTGSQLNEYNSYSGHELPLFIVGESKKEPLYRIDFFGGLLDVNKTSAEQEEEINQYWDCCYHTLGTEEHWFSINFEGKSEELEWLNEFNTVEKKDVEAFLALFVIGALISVLSVFSVLRGIFAERQSNITILKRIGASKGRIAGMFAAECFILTAVQTVLGIFISIAVYGVSFLFRVSFLDAEPISAFTTDVAVTSRSVDPFVFSAFASCAIMIASYIINALTSKIKYQTPKKSRKPRSLLRCFKSVFRQRGVSAVQTICLVLICFSAAAGYMYFTDNGKYTQFYENDYFVPQHSVNGFDMAENNIEEYYIAVAPDFEGVESYGNAENMFYTAPPAYTSGIGDETAEKLPECARVTGYLPQPFIICESEDINYKNKIEFIEDEIKSLITEFSSEEFKNFFSEGQLGSKYLYQAKTKLAGISVIQKLSQYVVDGEINSEKLKSGEEIIVISQSSNLPFNIGDDVSFGSATGGELGYGITDIVLSNAKIGAVIKLPFDCEELLKYIVCDEEMPYNFLTTADGAKAMGFQCAAYTEIYSSEKINGGLIPFSAEMQLVSKSLLERDNFIKKIAQYAGSIALLTVMSLLGFSAYFNGIGMKIRQKKYEISAVRAVGARITKVKKYLLLDSLKIPFFASVITYILFKPIQLYANQTADRIDSAMRTDMELYRQLLDNFPINRKNWWQPNLEIPMLILFLVLCAVTFLLTAKALKSFNSDIAGNLSEGRTRQ